MPEPPTFISKVAHDTCGLTAGKAEITLQIGGNARTYITETTIA
jgi:hypothetical protein